MSVYAETIGGLGNQLFQISAALVYAKKSVRQCIFLNRDTSYSVMGPRLSYWKTLFQELPTCHNFPSTSDPTVIVHQDTDNLKGYTPIPTSFLKNKSIILKGYYQDLRHLMPDFKEPAFLHKLFPTKFIDDAKECFLKTTTEEKKIAFLHFRRGDYKHLQHFHPLMTMTYYERAANEFSADVQFYVFCEEEDIAVLKSEIAKSKLLSSRIAYWVDTKIPDYTQLLMMGQCSAGGIMANSTFSCWAAYVREFLSSSQVVPKIVAPKRWFANTNQYNNILLPHWTILSDEKDLQHTNKNNKHHKGGNNNNQIIEFN